MTNRRNFLKSIGAIGASTLGLGLLSSCTELFEYSPYASIVDDKYKKTTSKNLELLSANILKSKDIKFAFIADSHYHYNKLDNIINHINDRDDIDFLIHAGDLTESGLLKEYEMLYVILNNSKTPYFTTIGNHDYRSNGGKIYKDMFGKTNYSFVFNDTKFVFFDDVFWESSDDVDFMWLENELKDSNKYSRVVVSAHIPPFGSQFTNETAARYSNILSDAKVDLSIHGHVHTFVDQEYYNDGVKYVSVDWVKREAYNVITLSIDSEIGVEEVVV